MTAGRTVHESELRGMRHRCFDGSGGAVTSRPLAQMQKIGDPPEAKNMRLVGYNDLQAPQRLPADHPASGQPLHRLYRASRRHPGYSQADQSADRPGRIQRHLDRRRHRSGAPEISRAHPRHGRASTSRAARRWRAYATARRLPKADRTKFYLLRAFGSQGHEIWDVTDPAKPVLLATHRRRLNDTHKSFWECDTGIAYLVSGVPGWRVKRMTEVYDLSDPAHPVKIRDFGLPGQEPGATGLVPTELHGDDLARAAGQPRLFRLRHQQGRHHADRRPRQAAQRTQGADARKICAIRRSAGSK